MGDTRSRVLLILTYLASLGCLVWTLRGANLGELKEDLATMDWWWLGVAVVGDIAVYCWQAIRWRQVLRPVEQVSFRHAVSAIYVGLFANEVLPFRAGEILRCYMVSRWTKLPFSVVISSALIERKTALSQPGRVMAAITPLDQHRTNTCLEKLELGSSRSVGRRTPPRHTNEA